MFGELPKVFDRNFAVNYFLPVSAFLGVSYFLLKYYGLVTNLTQNLTQDLLKGAVLLSLISYFGGVLLLVLNRDLYSILSGYGKFNPFKLFANFERKRYQKMAKEIADLDSEFTSCMQKHIPFPEKSNMRRNRLMSEIVIQFPDQERFILPTPFGNIVRAIEVYSRLTYGIEYSGFWSRMLTVIPADYRNIIENSKGQVDFWINIFFLSVCLLIEILIVWHFTGFYYLLLYGLLLIFIASLFMLRAQSAAQEWGEYVGSAFDVYKNELREKLGLPLPRNRSEEKAMWAKFSQAVLYRIPGILPELSSKTDKQSKKESVSRK